MMSSKTARRRLVRALERQVAQAERAVSGAHFADIPPAQWEAYFGSVAALRMAVGKVGRNGEK